MEYTIIADAFTAEIFPKLNKEDALKIKAELRYPVPNYRFTSTYTKNPDWDGYKTMFYLPNCTFSTGLVPNVDKLLKNMGYQTKINRLRDFEPKGSGEIYSVLPFDFQIEAVKRAIEHKYCVIDSPVRSGKTTIIAMLISKLASYPIIVVTSKSDLVLQTIKSIEESLKCEIGTWSEGKCDLTKKILITNYENVVRLPSSSNKELIEYVGNTKVLILDECHLAYTDKLQGVWPYTKNKGAWSYFKSIGYKIGLSGTPLTDAVDRTRIAQLIGPIVYKVPFKKLIDIGRVAQPKIMIYELPFCWFENFSGDYASAYEVNIVRNNRRNRFIMKLVESFKGKKIFVIVRKRYHGELLHDLIPGSVYLHGDISSDIRKFYYSQLNEGKINCIISTVGKLGLDIPNLDICINAEGIKARTTTIQKMRSLTASVEKEYGIVIDFMDKGCYTYQHAKSRLKQYKSINGFDVKIFEVK